MIVSLLTQKGLSAYLVHWITVSLLDVNIRSVMSLKASYWVYCIFLDFKKRQSLKTALHCNRNAWWLRICLAFVEKSQAYSSHGDVKRPLGPDDLRSTNLGRQVLSPFPMSPRDMTKISHDQHLLQFNCKDSSLSSQAQFMLSLFCIY